MDRPLGFVFGQTPEVTVRWPFSGSLTRRKEGDNEKSRRRRGERKGERKGGRRIVRRRDRGLFP
jgi:hypothetical protein